GLDQRHKNIKGTPADPDRLAVDQKLAAMRQDLETAELDDRRRLGHRIHRRNYSGGVRVLYDFSVEAPRGPRVRQFFRTISSYFTVRQRLDHCCTLSFVTAPSRPFTAAVAMSSYRE